MSHPGAPRGATGAPAVGIRLPVYLLGNYDMIERKHNTQTKQINNINRSQIPSGQVSVYKTRISMDTHHQMTQRIYIYNQNITIHIISNVTIPDKLCRGETRVYRPRVSLGFTEPEPENITQKGDEN